MLYSIVLFYLSVWMFGIAETGIARGSPPRTNTEVQKVGFPSTEIRFVSQWSSYLFTFLYSTFTPVTHGEAILLRPLHLNL
jgi:hypothetical protein